jgi:hypothetical protein
VERFPKKELERPRGRARAHKNNGETLKAVYYPHDVINDLTPLTIKQ